MQSALAAEQGKLTTAAGSGDELTSAALGLATRRAELEREIDLAEQELLALHAQRANRPPERFTIVPFDARTGTTRRPIVIECRADRMILVSEGITLTPADLDGFIPHFNPLSAGVRALSAGFQRIDGGELQPYVLLVVRPDGTVSYYVARMFLQPLGVPFGYELVGADQQFTWTPTDRELVRDCRRAIDEVLRERSRVHELSRLSGKGEQPVRLRGSGGEFRLDEVDRLRQPTRTVQFAGQRIERNEGGGVQSSSDNLSDERRSTAWQPREGGGTRDHVGGQRDAAPAGTRAGTPAGAQSSGQPGSSSERSSAGWNPGPGVGSRAAPDEPYAWRPALGSGIGIRRDIIIQVTATSLQVDDRESIAFNADLDLNQLSQLVAGELDHVLNRFGQPPQGFYWNPRLLLIPGDNGGAQVAKLVAAAKAWSLDAEVQQGSPVPTPPGVSPASSPGRGKR